MFWIMTTDHTRRDEWDRVLGMTELPVTTQRPIMIKRNGGKRPFFMIDAAALTLVQRMRLTGWVWKTKHVTAVTAAMMVDSGLLIDGRDCEVMEPVEDYPSALSFAGIVSYAA